MRWRKLGLVYQPDGAAGWRSSHAAVPVCSPIDDRHFTLLFSARDRDQHSRPGSAVISLANLAGPAAPRGPLMELGAPGTFDDSGVMPCWFHREGDQHWIYYIGWTGP